jgi:hypothetical protein
VSRAGSRRSTEATRTWAWNSTGPAPKPAVAPSPTPPARPRTPRCRARGPRRPLAPPRPPSPPRRPPRSSRRRGAGRGGPLGRRGGGVRDRGVAWPSQVCGEARHLGCRCPGPRGRPAISPTATSSADAAGAAGSTSGSIHRRPRMPWASPDRPSPRSATVTDGRPRTRCGQPGVAPQEHVGSISVRAISLLTGWGWRPARGRVTWAGHALGFWICLCRAPYAGCGDGVGSVRSHLLHELRHLVGRAARLRAGWAGLAPGGALTSPPPGPRRPMGSSASRPIRSATGTLTAIARGALTHDPRIRPPQRIVPSHWRDRPAR